MLARLIAEMCLWTPWTLGVVEVKSSRAHSMFRVNGLEGFRVLGVRDKG